MENKALLLQCCEKMGLSLTDKMAEQFMVYMSLLLEWNEKMNLTAITQEREIILKHFADCLSILPHLKMEEGASVIDVGTGAGFPGIPIKIVQPGLSVTLLDSLQKRIGFLEEVIERLKLENMDCVHTRAEDGGQSPLYREKFDFCLSRAVANLAVLAEYCLPFVKVGGVLAALKGPDAPLEVEDAKGALEKLGAEVYEIMDVSIPFTDLAHKLVIIKKVKPTPKQYPRKAGKVTKNPLK